MTTGDRKRYRHRLVKACKLATLWKTTRSPHLQNCQHMHALFRFEIEGVHESEATDEAVATKPKMLLQNMTTDYLKEFQP